MDHEHLHWFRSSCTGGSGTECVVVADLVSATGVRDSKRPEEPEQPSGQAPGPTSYRACDIPRRGEMLVARKAFRSQPGVAVERGKLHRTVAPPRGSAHRGTSRRAAVQA
ncbi:DUF397 domain-containing protein [Streptomyces sp. NPDC057543]|uniref:DUF397 domain-containing protein n=1 Tax=Streptomyces sp. NPDC057543 TaxID=3346163 RepID=UPI0036BD7D27